MLGGVESMPVVAGRLVKLSREERKNVSLKIIHIISKKFVRKISLTIKNWNSTRMKNTVTTD